MRATSKAAVGAVAVAMAVGVTWVQLVRARRSLPRVWIETVERRDVEKTITVRGRVVRPRRRTLGAPADAQVRGVQVRPGQSVRAGQPLVVLDLAPARARVDEARARARAARHRHAGANATHHAAAVAAATDAASLERRQRLYALGLIPAAALAAARHDEEMARLASILERDRIGAASAHALAEQASAVAASHVLRDLTVRAPADGTVTEVWVRAGQRVHAGRPHVSPQPLVTLAAAELVIEAPMEPVDAVRLSIGWPAAVSIDAYPERDWPARLTAFRDASGGGIAASLDLLEVPATAREGMWCVVRFVAARRAQSLAVPNHALVRLRTGIGVWTVRRGAIVPRDVTLGLRGDSHSEVLAGVAPGQPVVTGPYATVRTVRAGDAVIVSPASPRR